MMRKRGLLKPAYNRGRAFRAAGDNERRLRQAITGIECLQAKSARRERCRKVLRRLRPDRLGAAKSDLPMAQIECRALFRRDLLNAQIVGEMRAAAGRGAVPRDGLQPAQGALQKR